jgi:hypothetical protein
MTAVCLLALESGANRATQSAVGRGPALHLGLRLLSAARDGQQLVLRGQWTILAHRSSSHNPPGSTDVAWRSRLQPLC